METETPKNLINQSQKEEDVVARLSALLFNLSSESKPETAELSITESEGKQTKGNQSLNSYSILSETAITVPSIQSFISSVNPASEQDALYQLQSILVEPGLEDLAATVKFLSDRLEQVEEVVGDQSLNQKLAQLESQFADQSSQQHLESQLQDLAKQQRNLPLEINRIDQQLTQLASHISTPESLLELILPIMGELLRRKVSLSQAEMCEALVPIVDLMIRRRTEQDRHSMSEAIAILLPEAISQAISNFPEQTAKALAPEVALAIEAQINLDHNAIATALAPQIGAAIKQQIVLERDAMVDALYPVIGSTISKYLAEAIRLINQKVENAFSLEGIKRKLRARLKGVSEAELILQESMPFEVRAIFLIHKNSGLIIAEIQPQVDQNQSPLESDMIAGMLTAIRSFANDCLAQPGSELDQIEYGRNKILLEIAGYCYLAIVVNGSLTPIGLKQVRRRFGHLLQKYGKEIEGFEGDSSLVPAQLSLDLEQLAIAISPIKVEKSNSANFILIGIFILTGGLISLWIVNQLHAQKLQQLAENSQLQIAATPELAIYNLSTSATSNSVILKGKVPYLHLKQQAEAIALKSTIPNWLNHQIENKIQVANIPPDPVAIASEVARTQKYWQQQPDSQIRVNYQDREVTISGKIPTDQSQIVTQSFANIPGITKVTNTLAIAPPQINSQIYFASNSAEIDPSQQPKLDRVVQLLQRHPRLDLQIIGFSDPTGNLATNQILAKDRSLNVQRQLQQQGIDVQRLKTMIDTTFSTTLSKPVTNNHLNSQSLWQERRVKFRLFFRSRN